MPGQALLLQPQQRAAYGLKRIQKATEEIGVGASGSKAHYEGDMFCSASVVFRAETSSLGKTSFTGESVGTAQKSYLGGWAAGFLPDSHGAPIKSRSG